MKKVLLVVMLLAFSLSAVAQYNQMTDTWISFPNRQTLDSPRTVRVQYNLFVDPFGQPPSGESGRQFGLQATVILGGFYVEPSISTFPQLKDGYTDVTVSMGTNFHMFRTTSVRYYAGGRAGLEWRDTRYEIFGLEAGLDVTLYTNRRGTSYYIGGALTADHRESQEDGRYGDSSAENKNVIFSSSTVTEAGKLRFGIRF